MTLVQVFFSLRRLRRVVCKAWSGNQVATFHPESVTGQSRYGFSAAVRARRLDLQLTRRT